MLVKTPAMKLGVELRSIETDAEKLVWKGVANSMPCTVEMGGAELRQIAGMALHPKQLFKIIGLMLERERERERERDEA
jgi:hypothetical protein